MAQRYGGEFSPQGSPDPGRRFRNRNARNVNIAARLLFLAPLPLLLSGIGEIMRGDAVAMAVELGAFAALMLAAALLNEGLKAEAAYNARTIARPPVIPRKAFAAALTALGVGVASGVAGGTGLIGGAIFGLAAAACHVLAFGTDPMRRKGLDGISDFDTDRAARALDDAEAVVAEILAAARDFRDRQLEARVEDMVASVRAVFRTIEEDPRDLTRARKFIGVYLRGARDATRKFADLYTRTEYEALLTDLETSFRHHRDDLLKDDRSALDVEIEVLRERLQREGV